MERLQLLAHVALDREIMQDDGRKPVLVISAHDYTVAGAQQPRHSIAIALKSWRQLYSSMFEAVVVACGEPQTAGMLDKIVNVDIYASALEGATTFCDWHWHAPLLGLSVNKVLANIGLCQVPRVRSQPGRGPSDGGIGENPDKTLAKRPDTQTAMAMDLALETPARPAGFVLSPKSVRRPLPGCSSKHSRSCARPASGSITGVDSRTAHELAVANRMADKSVHDPLADAVRSLGKPNEFGANVGLIRFNAVSTFTKRQGVQAKAKMFRDETDKRAASLDMPEDLKDHVRARICEDALRKFDDKESQRDLNDTTLLVQHLAGEVDVQLQQRWKEGSSDQMWEETTASLSGSLQRTVGKRPDPFPKIGKLLQTAGRGVTSSLIQQHEALGAGVRA
uniref:Uncharacterized protein n=1 Tax=Pyrodinium bahamense TaxID=73915 RepID=A0A7S0B8U0_9DINO